MSGMDAQAGDGPRSMLTTVVVLACDMQGRLLGKRLSLGEFKRPETRPVLVSSTCLAKDMALQDDIDFPLVGAKTGWDDLILEPDIETLHSTPWLGRDTMGCCANFVNRSTEELFHLAPRSILINQCRLIESVLPELRIGVELEFYLFSSSYDTIRTSGFRDLTPVMVQSAQDLFSHQTVELYEFLDGVKKNLRDGGILADFGQIEEGVGQCELSIDPTTPLAAADRCCLVKQAIKILAQQRGWAASFMAKPRTRDAGSGLHLHVSLDGEIDSKKAAPSGKTAPRNMMHAMGGILAHVNDLMPFYAATINAYRRVESSWAAGWGKSWGYDNRSTTIRVISSLNNARLRFEFRLPGADSNPYLAIAALLASIRDGTEKRIDPGEAAIGDARTLPVAPLIDEPKAATVTFRDSEFVRDHFGLATQEHYSALFLHEFEKAKENVSEWELSRYFEQT